MRNYHIFLNRAAQKGNNIFHLIYALNTYRIFSLHIRCLGGGLTCKLFPFIFIVLCGIPGNGKNAYSQQSKLPQITITNDRSALDHIQEAQMLIDLGKYKKSITYLNAISKAYKGGNKKIEARIIGGLARNNFGLGLNHKSIALLESGIELIKDVPNNNQLIAIFNNKMSYSYVRLGDYKKARNVLLTSLEHKPIVQTFQMLSKLAIDVDNDFESSIKYLENGLDYLESIKGRFTGMKDYPTYFDELFKARITEGYAYHYLKKGDYSTAAEKYQEVLRASKKLKHTRLQIKTLRMLGLVYQGLGNPVQSNAYFTMHLNLNDSLMKAKNNSLSFVMQKFIKESKASISEKNTENKNLKLISIGILICIVGLIIYIIIRSKTHMKSNEENIKLKKRLDKEMDVLVALAKSNDTSFLSKFKQVNPDLYKKLTSLKEELTDTEISLCAMIWLKFSTKEIAQFTFVEHKSVQIKKYRLRKKLSLPKGTDLYGWMSNL